ncbi:MAG: hypothetical protein DHS20C16_17930 [Phycisphaerae bacterium]|nr:MAG: hypothetical protein DHS20C16_17930 [Phycisphaerae bacterium]
MVLRASTTVRIWGTENSWSLAGKEGGAKECVVTLEIQGDQRSDGYQLVMSPAGFLTADSWHESKDDALRTAAEMFGVTRDDWKLVD